MRRPETAKLEISQGDWLLVKRHLTAGEQMQMFDWMIRENGELHRSRMGLSKIVTYLLDWSFDDADDQPLVIRDQPAARVEEILLALPTEEFAEVLKAITEHDAAMNEVRDREKKDRATAIASSPISPSADS